jgi:hypothetical protein
LEEAAEGKSDREAPGRSLAGLRAEKELILTGSAGKEPQLLARD